MPNKEILYVTYQDEPLDEGFNYAIYLAGLLGEKLRVVLLNHDGKRIDDMMAAVTFAEANEHGTAREILGGGGDNKDNATLQNYVVARCHNEGVKCNVHGGIDATVSVIRNFISRKNIDLVLLSPLVTESRNILNKLLKTSPRPVVTMARGLG